MTGINYSGPGVLAAVANSHDRDAAWCERELGDVPVRPGSDWRNQVWGAPADWHVDSPADDATAWGIVWGWPGVVPVP